MHQRVDFFIADIRIRCLLDGLRLMTTQSIRKTLLYRTFRPECENPSRESLVNQPVAVAEMSDISIPALYCVTSVLHKVRQDFSIPAKTLELIERNIANTKQPRAAALVNVLHRSAGSPVILFDPIGTTAVTN